MEKSVFYNNLNIILSGLQWIHGEFGYCNVYSLLFTSKLEKCKAKILLTSSSTSLALIEAKINLLDNAKNRF